MAEEESDPVIDEIHEVRQRISARLGHDTARLVAYYMDLQQQYRGRLIDPPKSSERHDEFSVEPDPGFNEPHSPTA